MSAREAPGASLTALTRGDVCFSCLNQLAFRTIQRRHAATAAASAVTDQNSSSPEQTNPSTSDGPEKAYAVMAGTVLSRPPQLTRELSSFEKAFYLYQKRLNERTALPFTRYFYYRAGTLEEKEWKRKFRGRKSAARDIGQYSGYGSEAWNDEVLVGDQSGEWSSQVQALLNDAEGKTIAGAAMVSDQEQAEAIAGETKSSDMTKVATSNDAEVPKPFPRNTPADEKNDLKSLNRRLDRILYLLVQGKDGRWRFPEDRIYGRENLHQAAERVLIQSCGINMNTWIVGNHPIGHHSFNYPTKGQGRLTKIPSNELVPTSHELERQEFGEKVFFMKGRIMAGQADLSKNILGNRDFRWLTKEEIQEVVSENYWASVRNMLTDR